MIVHQEGKYDEALTVAKVQVENGAQVLDINMDEGKYLYFKCVIVFFLWILFLIVAVKKEKYLRSKLFTITLTALFGIFKRFKF